MKKVLFTATVDSHILCFHIPFLKLFHDKGYEVHVATNGTDEIPYCDKKIVIPFERSPYKLNNLKAIKQLRKVINEEKYDIIHTHTPMGSVVTRLAAKQASRKYHTRVIYTAHGFHFYKGAPLLNWLLFYPVEKYLAKYTDTIITINKEDYDLAKNKFSKRCKNIEYVPGVGIDEEKFNVKMTKKEKHELRESLGLKDDDFVIIYPAEISKRKRHIWLVNTLSKLLKEHKDIHILLPGRDSLNGECNKLVDELGLSNQIHFLGFRTDIPKLLMISNLSVSAAYQEGLPVNIMEAMYVGLPIVASDCRGNRDLVEDGKNGYLITIEDADRFSKCIESLYLNKNGEFGTMSKEIIKDYLLDKIMIDMDKIYIRKKRIIHLLASNVYSGAENVVCTIIENMKDKYDMAYCSPIGPIKDMLIEKKIDYYGLNKLSIKNFKKIIKDFKPDIIHAHDNRASVIASFFGNKYKVISHIHGNNLIMNSYNLKSLLFNYCSNKIYKLIWVSDSSLNGYYFRKNIIDKSKVLYNIINKTNVKIKSNEYNLNETYDLIYIGRIGYPKNPERLIDIVNLVKKKYDCVKVAIVGNGPDVDKIKTLINKYKLNNNIKVFGFKPNPFPILKNSKIMIMTSLYEGTPMCALEAQCLGKPIVATPVDGLKDIIINNYNGYLSDSNEEMVEIILRFIEDIKLYDKLSKNSLKRFELINNEKKYYSIIDEIYG